MKIQEKSDIPWDFEQTRFVKHRYERLWKRGIKLTPLFCDLERNNIYKNQDLTGLKIAVVYSTPVGNLGSHYETADTDSKETAIQVSSALKRRGMKVKLYVLNEKNIDILENINCDVIFNLCEWTGKDSPLTEKVFKILDAKKITYTGVAKKGWFETSDKWQMKNKLARLGVKTPGWQNINNLQYPLIVKPALEHCSMGLSQNSVVKNKQELEKQVLQITKEFKQQVLIEEFIDGRELQVTVLERDGKINILPPAEISYKKGRRDWPLLTYDVRWNEKIQDKDDPSEDVFAPVLDKNLLEKIESECRKAFVGCGLSGYGRADIRVKNNEVYILEMNSNPGLGDHYSYGMTLSQWTVGMTFSDLCFWIVTAALERFKKI